MLTSLKPGNFGLSQIWTLLNSQLVKDSHKSGLYCIHN